MSLDVSLEKLQLTSVYDANITHNLTEMAEEAGLYEALWRPDEIGITTAAELSPLLEAGLSRLLADPERFEQFAPKNGWGSYAGLVGFVQGYLKACQEHPDALVRADR